MEPLEVVISVRFSGSYKREFIRELETFRQSEISHGFFIEIHQTDVQREFNV
jgi:hypothetical protein